MTRKGFGLIVLFAASCTSAGGQPPEESREVPAPTAVTEAVAKPSPPPQAQPTDVAEPEPPKEKLPPPKLKPLSKGVVLSVDLKDVASGKPFVTAETNLPDATKLNVEIEGATGWAGEYEVQVDNGRFETDRFGGDDGLPSDRFTLKVLMYLPIVQPESVQAIVGAEGEKLKGKLVHRDEMGVTVELTKPFSIGDTKAAAQSLSEQRKEAKRIYSDISDLVKSGSGPMRQLRNSDDPYKMRECIELLQANQSAARQLSSDASNLPIQNYGNLQTAANMVINCVVCLEESSKRGCAATREELGRAKRELSRN